MLLQEICNFKENLVLKVFCDLEHDNTSYKYLRTFCLQTTKIFPNKCNKIFLLQFFSGTNKMMSIKPARIIINLLILIA